jgi:hypothetical protein
MFLFKFISNNLNIFTRKKKILKNLMERLEVLIKQQFFK